MNKFREPWPWESSTLVSDAPRHEWKIEGYYGFRIVPKTTCGVHGTPIIEVMESGTPTYWKCQKCPEPMAIPEGVNL